MTRCSDRNSSAIDCDAGGPVTTKRQVVVLQRRRRPRLDGHVVRWSILPALTMRAVQEEARWASRQEPLRHRQRDQPVQPLTPSATASPSSRPEPRRRRRLSRPTRRLSRRNPAPASLWSRWTLGG